MVLQESTAKNMQHEKSANERVQHERMWYEKSAKSAKRIM